MPATVFLKAGGERQTARGSRSQRWRDYAGCLENGVCQEKLKLLHQSVHALGNHSEYVRKYTNDLTAGSDGADLAFLKRRVLESRQRFAEARKQYLDHLKEHVC